MKLLECIFLMQVKWNWLTRYIEAHENNLNEFKISASKAIFVGRKNMANEENVCREEKTDQKGQV